ncbi:uncharacterized protein LOC142775050 [Rhipicephalus microplus]|uniref:uncharacterized protein LOC142775050 n=1 Tax=Rhipicephalus microplus TaxID=6941 RepID=UPI003F6D96CE
MAKAFGRVRHGYVIEVLHQFRFPTCFVDTIAILYSNLTCHVVVNGTPTSNFVYERGIRKGCPLWPSLFVLSLERLLVNIDLNTHVRSFPLTGETNIKVLAYADDVSLFVRDPASLEAFW